MRSQTRAVLSSELVVTTRAPSGLNVRELDRAAIASLGPIGDAEASRFAAIRARIAAGAPPGVALRDERAVWIEGDEHAEHAPVLQP